MEDCSCGDNRLKRCINKVVDPLESLTSAISRNAITSLLIHSFSSFLRPSFPTNFKLFFNMRYQLSLGLSSMLAVLAVALPADVESPLQRRDKLGVQVTCKSPIPSE